MDKRAKRVYVKVNTNSRVEGRYIREDCVFDSTSKWDCNCNTPIGWVDIARGDYQSCVEVSVSYIDDNKIRHNDIAYTYFEERLGSEITRSQLFVKDSEAMAFVIGVMLHNAKEYALEKEEPCFKNKIAEYVKEELYFEYIPDSLAFFLYNCGQPVIVTNDIKIARSKLNKMVKKYLTGFILYEEPDESNFSTFVSSKGIYEMAIKYAQNYAQYNDDCRIDFDEEGFFIEDLDADECILPIPDIMDCIETDFHELCDKANKLVDKYGKPNDNE